MIGGVIGPLWRPTHPSGVTYPSCTHVAPDACDRCDGTAEERREYWQATPAERREFDRGMAEWRQARTDTEGNDAA